MSKTLCIGPKKDGSPCQSLGLPQYGGYCIAHAPRRHYGGVALTRRQSLLLRRQGRKTHSRTPAPQGRGVENGLGGSCCPALHRADRIGRLLLPTGSPPFTIIRQHGRDCESRSGWTGCRWRNAADPQRKTGWFRILELEKQSSPIRLAWRHRFAGACDGSKPRQQTN